MSVVGHVPRITCCMILRNEGHTIYRALSSVDFVDEFIIGIDDTTNDNTQGEVERFLKTFKGKSTVYPFKWEKNFSKARNEGIDKASGDYILIMDGHEYLQSHRIYEMDFKHNVYVFEIENQQPPFRIRIEQARLFRNTFRYRHKSHNVILYKPDEAAKILGTVIIHQRTNQLSQERAEQRKTMNVPDLKERKDNGDKRAIGRLAQEFYSYQMWPEAVEGFKHYLEQEMQEPERYHVMTKLGMAYYYLKKYALAEQIWVQADAFNFDKRNAHYVFLGTLAKKFGNFEEALEWLNKALKTERPKQFYYLFPDFYYTIPKRLKDDLIRRTN